ncbi:MAG TPA: MFS transporter [Vicinamibacterales bacterium]|nr:MFS transporter [Vicinamibacterales bacterium]
MAETLAADDDRVFNKVAWRLLPVLTVAYVFNYLDRNNIGFAALTMNRDIGLTATQFGRGAGVLFVGYCFLEVPSNMILYRVGARRWLSRIMISWGLISAATIFVEGPWSFYLLRFLLGAGEAGFFPGVAFFLGHWFPAEYRTRVIAWFMVAIPISSVIGGALSGALLQMDGLLGLAGWKWLFILEGLPVAVLGLVVLAVLTERPEEALWLTDDEKRVIRERVSGEVRHREIRQLLPALKDPRVLILGAVQFGFLVGSYGVGIWLPQIIKLGHLSNLQIGFVTSGVYAVASASMILWANHVDRGGNKVVNLALSCALGGVGLLGAVVTENFWLSLAGLTLSLAGINAARGIFFTIPMRFLTGIALAGGIAFINSIGTAGGFVGPYAVGWLSDETGSFTAGLAFMAAFLLVSAALAWSLKLFVGAD